MNTKQYYAIWDTENKRFVTGDEAMTSGAYSHDDALLSQHYKELFSTDDTELVYMIDECGKVGEWEVVPVNVEINIRIFSPNNLTFNQ